MSNKNSEENNVSEVVNAVTGLVKAVPVYQDLLQPAVKEIGQSLQTVAKVVNVALAPFEGLVWGYDQIKEFVGNKVTQKLKDIPPENIISPDVSVAGPALESLRFNGSKEHISDLYASLIASSMDTSSSKLVHPGFVEMIRNMSSDDAKVLKYISTVESIPIVDIRCEKKGGDYYIDSSMITDLKNKSGIDDEYMTPTSIVNLERLGLIKSDRMKELMGSSHYDCIFNNELYMKLFERANENLKEGYNPKPFKYVVSLTALGRLFSKVCDR